MSTTREINQNLENIRSLLLRNTRTKNQVFQRTFLLKRRRTEDLKRKSQETALEAPNLVRNAVGRSFITQSMARTGKSFLERIMGFLGYLTAGWIFNNLPTWIALGKEFIARIQKGREIVSNFIDSVKGTFSGIGKVLNAALTNLKELDFLDSKKRLEKEWNNMSTQMNNIGKSIDEGYKLITTPLFDDEGKGVYSEEQIPELGTQIKEEEPKQQTTPPAPAPTRPQPTPPAQPSTSTVQTPKSSSASGWGPILDIISKAESRRDGYNSIADGDYHPRLSKMTLQEAYKSRGVRHGADGALGRYQFTNPFFEKASYAGLGPNDIFSPENQDKMAIALARVQVGVTLDSIKKDPIRAGNLLAQIWAGLPLLTGPNKGYSYYEGKHGNKSTITVQEYEAALRKVAGTPKQTPVQPQTPRVPLGRNKFESDMMAFRSFRTRFGVPADYHKNKTYDPLNYQMREVGVYGSGNYKIHPLSDDMAYEIDVHKGAGHWENRAMDIPVPYLSKEGDMVAEWWQRKGYKTIWRDGKGHDGHVHVEVPAHKTAEFFTLSRQMPSLFQERRGSKVVVVEQTGTTNTSSSSKQTNIINDLSSYVSNISKSMLTKLGF